VEIFLNSQIWKAKAVYSLAITAFSRDSKADKEVTALHEEKRRKALVPLLDAVAQRSCSQLNLVRECM
jgi:hypothetical protein